MTVYIVSLIKSEADRGLFTFLATLDLFMYNLPVCSGGSANRLIGATYKTTSTQLEQHTKHQYTIGATYKTPIHNWSNMENHLYTIGATYKNTNTQLDQHTKHQHTIGAACKTIYTQWEQHTKTTIHDCSNIQKHKNKNKATFKTPILNWSNMQKHQYAMGATCITIYTH